MQASAEPLLQRTGPGTAMGTLMRRYWVPAFFSSELPPNRPLRGKLLGENLVAFRDAKGKAGLVDERCLHRRGSLFFGRKEDDGLRCVFHGWKFDIEGRVIDRPAGGCEDAGALKAYPCTERAGVIWTYMGDAGSAPRFPRLDWMLVGDGHRIATRELRKGNWLDLLEQDPGAPGAPPLLALPFHTVVKQGAQPDAASRAQAWVPVDDRHSMVYTVHYSAERAVLEQAATAPQPAGERAPRGDIRDYLLGLLEAEADTAQEEEESAAFAALLAPLMPARAAAG